jgi:hypothetical protein
MDDVATCDSLATLPVARHYAHALQGHPCTVWDGDLALLAHCQGPTVRQTRLRGVPGLRRSVFDALPGEGRWETALVADGNIGIGGDPVALLARTRELVTPAGRVVVDVAPWGTGVVTRHVRLETSHGLSGRFPWTTVGADAVSAVARAAGLGRAALHRCADRWWAVVEARS